MKASLEIDLKSKKHAEDAFRALEQETEFKKRSSAQLVAKGEKLFIDIEADDIVALRATVNSYLRLLQIINGINETIACEVE